jgi:hypothetical protein
MAVQFQRSAVFSKPSLEKEKQDPPAGMTVPSILARENTYLVGVKNI